MTVEELERVIDETLSDLKGSLLHFYMSSEEWQENEDYTVDARMVLQDCRDLCKEKVWVYYDEVI